MADGSAFVIGGGTAGLAAARTLARDGWKVTMAEADRLGGTCIWRGCIPKKALYTSASAMRNVRRGAQFGLVCSNPQLDWQTALAWKWHSQETYGGDPGPGLAQLGVEVLPNRAAFVSPEQVEVDGLVFTADRFVIATGSESVIPEVPGAELCDTSEDALHYAEIPESLVVVGGGFIGVEMAGIYASAGSRVTLVVSHDALLDMLDAELGELATRRLEALGVEILLAHRFQGAEGTLGSLRALLTDAQRSEVSVDAARILLAIGRRPAVARLDLESAGIETDGHGRVIVDPHLRTTNPDVWVAGDAAGGMMHTPVANMEGRTVARSIISDKPQTPDCHAVPTTTFTVPQLASVGLTQAEAEDAGLSVRVARQSFDSIGAAVIEDERDGFVKLVIAEEDGRIVGGQVACGIASGLIYPIALAVCAEMTAEQMQKVPGVHPSIAEAVYYAAWL
jgi:pyruvate/2-oxoglutarate dehydrogenase complex dihydrolipoamide dehydrogenase (E3) component